MSIPLSSFKPLKARILSQPLIRRAIWRVRKLRKAPQIIPAESSPGVSRRGKRILFLEDRVPHASLGRGYPRSHRILREMIRMGYDVTFYPTINRLPEAVDQNQDTASGAEIVWDYGGFGLHDFLHSRRGLYDMVFVSRPHNMALLKPFLNVRSHPLRGTKIVYDAESLFCLREIARRRLSGESISDAEIKNMIESEMQLVDGSHSVVCVSEHESELFRSHGAPMVHTLGYALNATPTPDSYKDRSNILFVGALENGSPNADSVLWFIHEVLPRLRGMLPGTVKFLVVGPNETKDISSQDGVEVLGRVPDLSEQYGTARIFVAPTRFAAGIPLKVLEAASFGVPIVGTSMIARQLGWHHESELLVADTAADFATQCTRLYSDTELWQRTRQNALAKIKHEHSPEHFSEKLQMILEHTLTLG